MTTNLFTSPRSRVLVDNDFGGDPDGLFQLAHHLLSPSVDVRGVIGSQHHAGGFYGYPGTAEFACERAADLVRIMKSDVSLVSGSSIGLNSIIEPIDCAGARLIVEEAMRSDTTLPLYLCCGAGLTCVASAFLMEPRIADRLTLVWIGGPEHEGLALPPPGVGPMEYNLSIDRVAAQVIFNHSPIPLWQIPRDAYRQVLATHAEIALRVGTKGAIGRHLYGRLQDLLTRAQGKLGEAYVLGDSPLVLLTALQSGWEPDACSSRYVTRPCPTITEQGRYAANENGRPIRVYTHLDTRLLLEDFYAKLALAPDRDA